MEPMSWGNSLAILGSIVAVAIAYLGYRLIRRAKAADARPKLNEKMSTIILDKSFLQGSKATRIRELSETRRLAVSDALFYELLTGAEPGRSRCFAKFPLGENPVDLISHIGPLIREEIETRQRSRKPSEHREQVRFQFNPQLVQLGYEPPEEAKAIIAERTEELRSDVSAYIERIALVPTFFPGLLTGSTEVQARAHLEAERALIEPRALITFYRGLEPPNGERPLPPADLISEEWAIYRWLQVQLLFALDVFVRYRGNFPAPLTPRLFETMEHDVLDAQVLMLGCLEGAFATREEKLKRWFRLLRPDGELYE